MWFLTSSVGRYILAAVGGVILFCGLVFYIYHKGQLDERNSNASNVLVETEQQRKEREARDAAARGLTPDAADKCLRNPQGC